MSHVITGVNDICTKAPLLAKEWDYDKNKSLTPNQISYGSHAKYWWICERGHHYQAVVKDRYRGNGCPVCKRLKGVIKGNSLSLISPNNAEMWDIKKNNIKLEEISGNSAYNAWWICPKGHTWQEPVHHRIRTDSCPICSGRKLVPGINDINTLYPDIIEKEWDFNSNSQNPSQIKPTSIQKVHWICKKGHRYSMSPHHRLQRHQCCPYCAGKYPVIGINDLFTSHPELKNMWDYDKNTVNPTSLSSGSSKKAWWKCSSGHSWSARVSHIAKKRSGCPICAESGGAKAVKDVLDALCIEYKCEYIIPDRGRLRDDFAIFKDNSLVGTIEYNGQQHYSPIVFKKGENAKKSFKDTVERDIRKRKYLIEHDIPQLVTKTSHTEKVC